MAHISTDLDEAACHEIMRRYKLASKGEAINLALRKLAAEPPPTHRQPPNPCPPTKSAPCGVSDGKVT